MTDDVIVAISTPYGKAGIAVVRMSGKGCLDIAKKMFTPYSKHAKYEPNLMILGKIDLIATCDKGFLVYFQSPKSYTGEDVVEFQCHGGVYVAQKIVERALSLGARLAEAGEFSKRAFFNGKMSLDEAEGVIDTINAESESELKSASSLMRGMLYNKIHSMTDTLVDIMSEIEVNLDYPEHDIEYETKENIASHVSSIKGEIDTLVSSAHQGRLIKNGINIAIVGKPNVGKSMLLNTLIGEEQAIVTDIAGTTRDVVAGSIEYNGMKFNFLDTAGLRETSDKVESIGIDKAKQTLNESDIVLFVLDVTEIAKEDMDISKLATGHNTITIINKIDLDICDEERIKSVLPQEILDTDILFVSAKDNVNIDTLKEKIYNRALSSSSTSSCIILTNLRHVNILESASNMCDEILNSYKNITLDLIAQDVRLLYDKLCEVTGESLDDKVIDKIFSKFCLGK